MAQSSSNAYAEIANKWASTADLIEAGGLIHGITVGRSMVYFHQALCTGAATHFR